MNELISPPSQNIEPREGTDSRVSKESTEEVEQGSSALSYPEDDRPETQPLKAGFFSVEGPDEDQSSDSESLTSLTG